MKIAHFYAYGSIGQADPYFKVFTGSEDPVISAQKVSEFLQSLSSDVTDIHVHINSNGGQVSEGFAIYDLLTNSGKTITTIGEGSVKSIATVVFLSGTERELLPNAEFLIHNPWIDPFNLPSSQLTAEDLQNIADEMKSAEDKMSQFYADKTGTDISSIQDLMKEDKNITADKALELKFATKILTPVKAFAFAIPTKHKEENTMSKAIDAINAKVDKIFSFLKTKADAAQASGSTITDGDGKTYNTDNETVDVGTKVTNTDGTPAADMTITLADGTVVVTDSNGVVTSVTAPAAQAETDVEKLNAKVAELTKQNEELTSQLQANETKFAETERKIDLIAKSIGSTHVVAAGKTVFNSTKKTDEPVNRVKEYQEKLKEKNNQK